MSLPLSPKMENLLSPRTKTRSLDYKLYVSSQTLERTKSFAIVFKPRKVKARVGEQVVKDRSENFVVDVKEMKNRMIFAVAKEAAVTCQNDHFKERKISENRKK